MASTQRRNQNSNKKMGETLTLGGFIFSLFICHAWPLTTFVVDAIRAGIRFNKEVTKAFLKEIQSVSSAVKIIFPCVLSKPLLIYIGFV